MHWKIHDIISNSQRKFKQQTSRKSRVRGLILGLVYQMRSEFLIELL